MEVVISQKGMWSGFRVRVWRVRVGVEGQGWDQGSEVRSHGKNHYHSESRPPTEASASEKKKAAQYKRVRIGGLKRSSVSPCMS